MKAQKPLMLLAALGIIAIVVSAFPISVGAFLEGQMEPHHVKVKMYGFAGDVHYDLEVYNGSSISIYVLDLHDSFEFIRTHELANLTPVVSLENISSQEGVFSLMIPATYSIVALNPSNATITFELFMYRVYPQTGLFLPGCILLAIGGGGLAVRKYLKHSPPKD